MAEEKFRRKLTAILSADVAGYSRLMEEDELVTIETLTSHKEIMRKLIRQYRGRVVDSTGDNLLAEFGSVVDAVQCAVEVQQVLSAKNETLPENRRMYFRIGINLGDVVDEGERIYGDGVNVAARVESLAEGGGISISGTAYDQLGKKLPLGYEYLGEQSVKNIEKPVRVYRILTEAEAAGKVIGEIRPKTKQLRGVAIGAVAVLVIVAGALAIWNFYLRPPFEPASEERMAFPLPDNPSIAVLPFVNMSEDPKQEYFSDGLTQEIITALSKVPKLFVIARNSTFSYKGKSVKVNQVAEELGVRYVLEGSVRKAGDRVRITAQLIDALGGRHLWAERYKKDLKDIFALQDEITMKITTSLHVKLTEGEQARMWGQRAKSLDVFLKVLKARWFMAQGTTESHERLGQVAQEIINMAPEIDVGYNWLGLYYWLRFVSFTSPQESLMKAYQLGKRALSMDESNAANYRLLGNVYLFMRQYDEAIAAGKRSVALEPSSAASHGVLGLTLSYAGDPDEAIISLKQGVRLNPFPPYWYFVCLGRCYIRKGQYDKALVEYNKAQELAPDNFLAFGGKVVALSLLGQEQEARAAARKFMEINPYFSVDMFASVVPVRDSAYIKKITDAMRKAGLK
jgi:adenylate cyclase